MSLNRCIDIEINGVQYPFHFGMQAINKFSKLQKWDADPAYDIASRLLTVSGSQKHQTEFHKIAASLGAAMAGQGNKPPTDAELEDEFYKIVGVTQNDIFPELMKQMGIDVTPAIDRLKKILSGDFDLKS